MLPLVLDLGDFFLSGRFFGAQDCGSGGCGVLILRPSGPAFAGDGGFSLDAMFEFTANAEGSLVFPVSRLFFRLI